MKPKSRLSFFLPTLLGTLCLAVGLRAQVESEREFQREIEVVRSLAKDWGFIDLAQAHIEELRKSPALTNDLNRLLTEVSAEVLFLGARRIRDLEERQKVLRESIQKFKDYLVEFEGSKEAPQVRSTLAQACEEYGAFLANRIELEKDPDKRKAFEEEALTVFREGIKAANEAMASLETRKDDDNDAKVNFFLSWMRKGTLLLRWAATLQADRDIKLDEAREELEEFILEAGEETLLGMLGLLELSRSYDIGGQSSDAIMMFEGTIDQIMTVLESPDNPPTQSRGALLFELAERAYVQLGEIHQKAGDTAKALAVYEKYNQRLEQFNASPSFNFGDRIVLIGAQAYFASGGDENRNKALELAKGLAERHPADFTGIKAKDLIGAIVDSGASVGAGALFEAANGLYQSKKYTESIQAFKRVLRSLETPEDQQQYGLRSWAQIANAFAQLGRFVEAFFAASEGIKRFGESDPEMTGRLAALMVDSASGKRLQTKDPFFEKLEAEAKDFVRQYTSGSAASRLIWSDARAALNADDFDKAIELYRKIPKDFEQYELAQVRIAVTLYRKGDFEAARKELDRYEAWANDSFNSIPPSEVNRQNVRRKALAEMEFHRGLMLADEALGRDGRTAEPSKLKDVVRAFKGFRERFKNFPELATRASYDLIDAYLELEKIDEAELEYTALKQQYPADLTVAVLAVKLFKARQGIVEAIESEIEAIPATPSNASKLRDAKQRMRAEIRRALDFAKTYTNLEREPNYGLLRSAAKLALKIEDYEIARNFLNQIIKVYGDSKQFAETIDKFVKPDLAEIDLLAGKFDSALKSIEDALSRLGNSRNELYYQLIQMKAFALAGYRTHLNDVGVPVRQNGLGRFKEAYDLMWIEYGKFVKSKFEQRSYEWYLWYFDCMDIALKVAGNQDSAFMSTAQIFFNQAQSTDNFKKLNDMGTKGERLVVLYRQLGRF